MNPPVGTVLSSRTSHRPGSPRPPEARWGGEPREPNRRRRHRRRLVDLAPGDRPTPTSDPPLSLRWPDRPGPGFRSRAPAPPIRIFDEGGRGRRFTWNGRASSRATGSSSTQGGPLGSKRFHVKPSCGATGDPNRRRGAHADAGHPPTGIADQKSGRLLGMPTRRGYRSAISPSRRRRTRWTGRSGVPDRR